MAMEREMGCNGEMMQQDVDLVLDLRIPAAPAVVHGQISESSSISL